jgi:hypothetical protein
MKVSDITAGKLVLESLAEKKRLQKESVGNIAAKAGDVQTDVFNSDKKINVDVAKINELQKSYLKDNASLEGLSKLQDKVDDFEKSSSAVKNFEKLSLDLGNIVSSTKYNGENVISYLSTQIKDDKSLYTFKLNLSTEIENLTSKLSEERKNIAMYLVRNENMDVAYDFSSEKTARNIADMLSKDNAAGVFKGIANLSSLLGIDK